MIRRLILFDEISRSWISLRGSVLSISEDNQMKWKNSFFFDRRIADIMFSKDQDLDRKLYLSSRRKNILSFSIDSNSLSS